MPASFFVECPVAGLIDICACLCLSRSPHVDAYLGADVHVSLDSKDEAVSLSWPEGVQVRYCHPLPREQNCDSADEPSRTIKFQNYSCRRHM